MNSTQASNPSHPRHLRLRPTTVFFTLLGALMASGCSQMTARPHAAAAEPSAEAGPAAPVAPLTADALYKMGRYYQGSMRYADAIKAFEDALARDPSFADAHNGLGVIYAEQGRYAEAVAQFRAAVALQPSVGYLQANLGYAYLLQGENAQALAALQAAERLEPGNQKVAENLALARTRVRDTIDLAAAADRASVGQEVAPAVSRAELPATATTDTAQAPPTAPASTSAQLTVVELDETPIVLALTSAEGAPERHLEPDVMPVAVAQADPGVTTAGLNPLVATPAEHQSFVQAMTAPVAGVEPAADHDDELAAAIAAAEETRVAGAVDRPESAREPMILQANERSDATVANAGAARDSASSSPVGAPKQKAPARPAGGAGAGLTVEVSNGNGVPGLARRLAVALDERGVPARRVTNTPGFNQPFTEVLYRADYRNEAMRVQAMLPANVALVESSELRSDVQVKIVLGKDLRNLAALLPGRTAKVAMAETATLR